MQIAEDIAATSNSTGPGRPGDPCIMVIFGASGDLTKRKLIPALYNLAKDNLLSKEFALVGFARNELSSEQFRDMIGKEIGEYATTKVDPDLWHWFSRRIYYCSGDFDDAASYSKLCDLLTQIDKEHGTRGNYFYYLATAPNFFAPIVKQLGTASLVTEDHGWRRVIIEKPFGRNYDSAVALNKEIRQVLAEKQIYRIDHYLGKETVQNILVFRFANGIFEPIWNRRYVDHVQITVAESIGIEQRGRYYEEAGALHDMIANHLMQVLSIVAMEAPVRFAATPVRDEKVKLIRSIKPLAASNDPAAWARYAVRGQYGPGFISGKPVVGYREEPNVARDSTRETYAALRLEIENWRWAGVPFYLRSGKRLPKRVSEVAIRFKSPPYLMFDNLGAEAIDANVLVMRIQPDEGISLRFEAKVPGTDMRLRPVNMDFHYGSSFGEPQPEAYETLLLDAMLGDGMLFARYDMAESVWALTTPLLEFWEANPPKDFPNYAAGSWGPKAADEFLAREGREWRRP